MEENHDYNQIIGNSSAPYINGTLIKDGALMTNDYDNGHPSEPNYLAGYAGSTFGISDDNPHSESDPTLGTILKGAGDSFVGYAESPTDDNHDPWVYFPEGTSVQQSFSTSPLATGNYGALPTVSFVAPNVNDDMHDGTVQQGDTWLKNNLSGYEHWAQTHNSLLIVTWDESETGDHIATILDGAHIAPGTTSSMPSTHYNLLSTILASEGLSSQVPRNAAAAAPYNVFATTSGAGTLAAHTVLTSATEDQALSASTTIATFTDTNTADTAAEFTAKIDWNTAGISSAGTISGGNGMFTVMGGHTYGEEGAMPLSVIITRTTDNASVTANGTVTVADTDKLTASGTVISGSSGSALTATVATFTDANKSQVATGLKATINWGDGTSSAGTISGSRGTFGVSGTHTYANAGTDAVSVSISDPGGTSAQASSTADVSQGSTGGTGPQTAWHYAPNGNFDHGAYNAAGDPGADGFNLADVSDIATADSLPTGDEGLIWTGDTTGLTSSFEQMVNQAASDPHVFGFYLADEPDDSATTIANIKAEVQYINAHAPTKMAFIVAENFGTGDKPSYGGYTPQATGMTQANDLLGLDPYPVTPGGFDQNEIPAAVQTAEAAGWSASQIVPVYQAFGGGSNGYDNWTMPTTTQAQEMLQTWGGLVPKPVFDYAYSWGQQASGESCLANTPAMQQVFAAHNG